LVLPMFLTENQTPVYKHAALILRVANTWLFWNNSDLPDDTPNKRDVEFPPPFFLVMKTQF
jgi:hypothetical protein